jgi:hypothetical protein
MTMQVKKAFLMAALLVFQVEIRCSLAAETDITLKLHLDFDEDFSGGRVIDASGNGNDGWQMDSTNWITATSGVFGSIAAQFTYVGFISNDPPHVYPLSQYIAVTNLNGFAFLTNATISLWAKFDSNSDVDMQLLDSGYNVEYEPQAVNSWSLGRDGYSPPYLFLCFTVYPVWGGGYQILYWPQDVDSIKYATSNFHLYSATIDCPGNQAIAYYDGQPYMTNTIGLPWLRTYGCGSQPWLCIGAFSHDGTPQWGDDAYPNAGFFVGRMDDVRIYNRTLSAADVQALYQGSTYAQNLAIQRAASQSVQVRWDANSNAVYQVEYRSNLAETAWSPLQSAIPGSVTNSVIDSILGQRSRFYRVRVLP